MNKIRRITGFTLTLALCLTIITGCAPSGTGSATGETESSPAADQITYEQITADEAKSIMDSGESYILLDVRTQEEYDAGHIEGAILLPDYEIGTRAETVLGDKDALILVYYRSGRRSQNAAKELAALGYTNVKDFGGIINWTYGTVTG